MTGRDDVRHLGMLGATSVGVGAIVGGGILALAGAAFSATGPSAMLAFALNGVIAFLTALSFAEVASKFPQSGGTYTFAKKVLSVDAAFMVGWVVWFASIVAAVLYALGFGQFAAVAYADLWTGLVGTPPPVPVSRTLVSGLAVSATLLYAIVLTRSSGGGGPWMNIGKVLVFAGLIVMGFWAMRDRSADQIAQSLRPFLAAGWEGLLQAMGFTFIALQGFDLIAAVGGEVKRPEKTIPRAMLCSLSIALAIYLPLLLVISTVGTPSDQSVTELSRNSPETLVAIAAQNYLGPFGYWLVVVAAILSMLTALQANLFAASRVALAMSQDRTLPRALSRLSSRTQLPARSILLTALIVIVTASVLPDLAAAGAASSLIFLVTFALAHWVAVLVRQRSPELPPFRVPLYPLVPVVGGVACLSLAFYQGFAVPTAGSITLLWLSVGGILFLGSFARRARVTDESTAALDPELARLRGKSPLVLLPIANPDTAPSLVELANALAPPSVGRVLLLSVIVADEDWIPGENRQPLERTQDVLSEAIAASVENRLYPEALATVASQPWNEIARVARLHNCESLLLGFSNLSETSEDTPLDDLMGSVSCDIVVLRAPKGWHLSQVERILIPTGGRGGHDRLLARVLGSMSRRRTRRATLLRVLPTNATAAAERHAERELGLMSQDLCDGAADVRITHSDDPPTAIAEEAVRHDLLILGVQRISRTQKLFGQFAREVAQQSSCPLLLISRRG